MHSLCALSFWKPAGHREEKEGVEIWEVEISYQYSEQCRSIVLNRLFLNAHHRYAPTSAPGFIIVATKLTEQKAPKQYASIFHVIHK